MTYIIKNVFKYILVGAFLYFLTGLAGLSSLLLFPPNYLLFNENFEEEKIKLNLYKDFAKMIYENINTPLIKNLTLTKDNESCPDNFDPLIIKNQYYGHFSKFYGNKSICIERLKSKEYSFKYLLKGINYYNESKKNIKDCGELIKDSNIFIFVPQDIGCPLNNIEINSISRAKIIGNYYYKIGPGDQYLIPIYGNKKPIITNIIINNNIKLCLEKENKMHKIACEFPDYNECFIDDIFEQIYSLELNEDYKLYPNNLVKWNLPKNNIVHNYCNKKLYFHIFTNGYINFTDKNLLEFEEEFPESDFTKNPLYKTYKVYKSLKNIDNFFYLISYNLFIWSLIHFIFQILLYYQKKGIRNIYIRNGIILFLFKLFSLLGMIIHYFLYYLKIEKVYLIMIDKPRNKVLEYYSKTRYFFIIKVIIICLLGFIIICIDLIIIVFTITIQWGVDFKIEEKEEIEKIEKSNDINHNYDNPTEDLGGSKLFYNTNAKKVESEYTSSLNEKQTNLSKNGKNKDEISLKFICRDNLSISYLIIIGKNECFMNAIKKLRETYPELKEKEMIVFIYDSNIINTKKTIKENGIYNDNIIFIISK